MRKKLLALLAGLIIMIPAAFADTTFDLVGGFSGVTTPTYIGIGFGTTGNSGGTNSSNFSFMLGADAEADIFFSEQHGMYVGVGFSVNVSGTTVAGYNVGLGYAYKMYFDDFDLLITAGPHVRGTGDSGTFGLSANVYLDFYLTSNLFLRGGGGVCSGCRLKDHISESVILSEIVFLSLVYLQIFGFLFLVAIFEYEHCLINEQSKCLHIIREGEDSISPLICYKKAIFVSE